MLWSSGVDRIQAVMQAFDKLANSIDKGIEHAEVIVKRNVDKIVKYHDENAEIVDTIVKGKTLARKLRELMS